jgi:hypothetical protein
VAELTSLARCEKSPRSLIQMRPKESDFLLQRTQIRHLPINLNQKRLNVKLVY